MATNKQVWLRNLDGASEPLRVLGKFQAGSTQAVKRGEILELSSGNWIPLDADQSMAGVIAVADEEIKAGDLAGYYPIIVPRPGDVFEYALDTANNTSVGTSVYWSDSQTVSESGSNELGTVVGQDHYPLAQRHLSDGQLGDMGTTVRSTDQVQIVFTKAASYYAALVV